VASKSRVAPRDLAVENEGELATYDCRAEDGLSIARKSSYLDVVVVGS
jgi:hypothetical protein